MKYIVAILSLMLIASYSQAQKVYDPCQKLDTNDIKKLIVGTWVDTKDSSHVMVITDDSVEENIIVNMGGKVSTNYSYWNYKFTDNIFTTDAVTCYSLREYKEGYSSHVDLSINSIDAHYLLIGASGKKVFKRKG
ncbi:MAG TPA: hypothetical protein VNZ45_04470 [Bacteroidia bacterium]|jgi:hypothetical protein|nr:hypothetical protein [Bacteroidia bacterium]